MIFPILYKKTSTGATQTWEIIIDGNTFYTRSGQLNGKITQSKPTKCVPKNVGKKNESSGPEQAITEAQAKWDKQIKKNYKEDISKIDEKAFFAPMLAKKFIDYKDKIQYPVIIQDKLNGIRCAITAKGAFSRTGEQFFCVDHILKAVAPLFKVFPDLVLDGELYNPIYKNQLNQIASLVSVNRKLKDISKEDIARSKEIVQFHVYDGLNFNYTKVNLVQTGLVLVTHKTPYRDRSEGLAAILPNIKYIYLLENVRASDEEDILDVLKVSKKEKREGIIIRIPDSPYENKRSKNLLKLKNFSDAEFEVVALLEGTGNWVGCVKTVTCKLNKPATDGRTEFDSNIRGSQEDLAKLWKTRKQHIGKTVTVEYQEMSEYGIPLIPYCDAIFRDYE